MNLRKGISRQVTQSLRQPHTIALLLYAYVDHNLGCFKIIYIHCSEQREVWHCPKTLGKKLLKVLFILIFANLLVNLTLLVVKFIRRYLCSGTFIYLDDPASVVYSVLEEYY